MSEGGSVRLGTEIITYEVRRSTRRTLGISVEPDGRVSVSAPAGVPLEIIETRLARRGGWVLETLRNFERLRPRTPPRRFVSGETHRFLGRQYRLRVEPEEGRGVRLTRTHLVVGGLPPDEPKRISNRITLFYQREARRVFEERLKLHAAQAGVAEPPRLVIQPMTKRWGSLSRTGRTLLLNRRLIEADLDAIDFVIAHELCHLVHRDHGPAFETLLTTRMPDWRGRKRALERWML